MKSISRLLKVSFTIILLLIVFISIYWFFTLDLGQEPKASDIIISIEGGTAERATKAVELLNNGYSRTGKIIISPYFEIKNHKVTDWYLNAGVDMDELVLEYEATSTWTNATNTLQMMKENKWESAIIVTDDYHMRRTILAYNRANINYDFKLNFVSAYATIDNKFEKYCFYTPRRRMAYMEVIKYWGYLFYMYYFMD